MLQPDGPLRGLALVTEAREDGSFTAPQLTFTTDDTEATAVVGLGNDIRENAKLTVDWYRLVGIDGREHLFTHEIAVGPGGHAFSQGLAERGLAPGLYETVATLGDRLVRTPWVVRVADQEVAAAAGPAFTLLSTGPQAQSTLEDWEIPGPGESGWSSPDAPPAEPSPPGPCEIDNIFPGSVPMRDVKASVSWVGVCSTVTLTATVSGPPQIMVSRQIAQGDLSFLRGDADVCELPGGSDLPGTVVRFAAEGSEGARGTESYPLMDLGETLTAGVESTPPAGSRVEPGQALSFLAIAMTFPPALGVERLSLYAGDELIESVGNKSGSDEPQACDLRRLLAVIESRDTYRVPDSPSPVIEICAEALGFDGTKTRECIEFFTGEVWEGTVELASDNLHDFCTETSFTARIELVVAEDGEAVGSGTFDHGATTCEGGGTLPAHSGTLEASGRKTDETFTFFLTNVEPLIGPRVFIEEASVPIDTGNAGETEVQAFGGEVIYHVTLECKTCGR